MIKCALEMQLSVVIKHFCLGVFGMPPENRIKLFLLGIIFFNLHFKAICDIKT